MSKLSNTQIMLIKLASSSLFGSTYEKSECDWSELRQEALDQAVFPQIYSVVKSFLPKNELPIWKALNEKITARSLTIHYEHDELHTAMTEINCPYVILKGSGTAYYYPDPISRMMGDVDFLVKPEDVKRAGEKIEQCGFHKKDLPEHSYHDEYERSGTEWELHRKITDYPKGRKGDIIQAFVSDIIDTARSVTLAGFTMNIPDDFHHCIVMLLHIARHLTKDSGIGLRHLCDWAVFVDKVDISNYKKQLEEMGLWVFACDLTAVSHKYLAGREYSWCRDIDDEFLESFITDIICSGNFGKKELQSKESNSIVKYDSIFEALISRTRVRFPVTVKYPFLLPLGMVICAFRYLYLRLSGKSSWLTKQDIDYAKNRKNIYNRFKLYE